MTAEQAWTEAGLNYDVALEPLMTQISNIVIPDQFAVVRQDNRAVFGVVGNSYTPIQNHEAFGFLDALVGENKLEYHTAGALGQGERVWMLAKLPGHIVVKDHDVSDKYLLLSNAHDGKQSMRVHYTTVRVVCQNTLSYASSLAGNSGVWIRHRGDLVAGFAEAQRVLGLAERFYDDLEDRIQKLVRFHPTVEQVVKFVKELYPDPKPKAGEDADEAQQATRAALKSRQAIIGLFEGGLGNQESGIRHTGWALVNAATEYVDHHRHGSDSSDYDRRAKRLDSNFNVR